MLLQKDLLENACNALTQEAPNIAGRLYSIASDGDSRRRQATVLLTMDRELESESELREILGKLEPLNLRCGSNQKTPDFEYKHVLKRLRNTLLRMKCTTLDGVVLTPQLLKSHLLQHMAKDERGVNAILSPKDKQDVKLMYDLLTSIATLPPASLLSSPVEQKTRVVLRLLGHLYAHLLETYTNIHLTLHQQLEHLSSAAHLVLVFYKREKGGVMPSQLYFDLMCMIKNVYFCVAKTQLDDPEGRFWVILLGTDPLEIMFGRVRTIIGNDSN